MIVRVPPPCPVPGEKVGAEWSNRWQVIGSDDSMTIYQMAPAVADFMTQIKRYCKGIDALREN